MIQSRVDGKLSRGCSAAVLLMMPCLIAMRGGMEIRLCILFKITKQDVFLGFSHQVFFPRIRQQVYSPTVKPKSSF